MYVQCEFKKKKETEIQYYVNLSKSKSQIIKFLSVGDSIFIAQQSCL